MDFCKKFKHLFLFIIYFGISNCSYSQLSSYSKGVKDTLFSSTKDFVCSPFNLKNDDYVVLGSIAVGTSAFYFFDEDFKSLAIRNRSNFATKTSKYLFEPFGNYIPIGSSILLLSGGLIFNNKNTFKAGIGASQSIFFASSGTFILKNIFQRKRPYETDSKAEFTGPFGGFKYSSFPSGHTVTAFAFASFISTYYGKTWLTIVCYSLATCTAISRIYDNKHWASDVVFSSAIGTITGIYFGKKWKNKEINMP